VTVTAKDEYGKTGTATETITISAQAGSLVVSAGSNITTNAGATVTFAGTVSGGTAPYNYSWNFGDGTTLTAGNTASFTQTDTTTQGNWTGVYGAAGYNVIGSTSSYPSYATVTPSGQASWTWAATTSDVRGLLIPGSTSNRIAGCWFNSTSFTIDVNLTDGQVHPVSLYALDWDSQGRSERIQVLNASSGAVLNTQTISSFSGGEYLTWNVSGHVQFKVTSLGGNSAVVSGLFIGAGSTAGGTTLNPSHVYANPGTYTATLTATDSAEHSGSSSTTVTVNDVAPMASLSGPNSGTVGTSLSYTASATDVSPAVQAAGFTYAWNFGDGGTGSGATASHSFASAGTYTVSVTAKDEYGKTGTATETITILGGPVVNAGSPVTVNAESSVTFSQATETGGTAPFTYTWNFGDGTAQQSGNLNPSHTYPNPGSYTATVTVTDAKQLTSNSSVVVTVNDVAPTASLSGPSSGTVGTSQSFTASATDVSPAVQAASFTYAWNFGDGGTGSGATASHSFASAGTYTVTVTAKDEYGKTGTATETITISAQAGSLVVSAGSNITTNAGALVTFAGAVSGGAAPYNYSWNFGDGTTLTAGNTASFVQTDTTTQGNWIGVYGAAGYNVIGSTSSYPSYATVTPSGQASWTWASTTSDVRGLLIPGSTSNRIAGCWFNNSSFTIDVNLTDGQTHPVSLYALDWDSSNRIEQIQVFDASSGAILNTQTINSFSGGEYLTWNVSGHVQFKVTSLGGSSAVVSGLFIGAALTNVGSGTLTPSHVYSNPGTYTATLTATDSAGHSGSASTVVTVSGAVPTVTVESPASGATGVALSSTISAALNEAVQASTIQFALTSSSGASVAATVAYNSSTNTATLTPNAALAYSTTYTAAISGAVSSGYGVAMTAPFTWSFSTPVAPAVSSETPSSSNADDLYNAGVAVSSPVSVTFNQPVQAGTIAFTLTSGSGNSVAATVAYNSSTNTDTLTPNAALAYGTTYTATVSGAVSSSNGVAMLSPFTWSFTTDAAPPTVIVESPASGATGVAVSSPVTAWFSQSLQPYVPANGQDDACNASVENGNANVVLAVSQTGLIGQAMYFGTDLIAYKVLSGSGINWTLSAPYQGTTNSAISCGWVSLNYPVISLTYSGGSVAGGYAYSLGTNAVLFIPSTALAYNTVYTATVSSVVNAAGDPMTAPFTWSFTTAASSATAPTVNSESPAQGATNVALSSPVTATFNVAVQPSTISFTLTSSSGATVPATVSYNSSDTTATLTPGAALAYATTYTATLNGAQSSSGTSPVSWSFTTIGPTVISVSPPANSTGVPVSFTVSATFNESVQASSITSSDFTLETAAGTLVPATVTYNSSTNTATLTPSAALTYSTTYTVSVSGGTDASGHTMASPFTWSFTTAPAALASILSSLTIPTSLGDRIWWTPARIQEAKAWWATHSYVPASTDAEGNAFAYVMTGNTQYGMTAVNLLLNFSISAGELEYVASDTYRWSPWVPIVFDWCYNLMTPTQVSTVVSEYNNYAQIMDSKSWGGPGAEANNYYWGYLANELNWAIATYYINPMAPTFLYDGLVTRWQDGVLPYFAGAGAGGVPAEGSSYGRAMLQYPDIAFTTLGLMGDDLLAQTNWYQEAAIALIYGTSVTPIDGNYIQFPYGNEETPVTGAPVNNYYYSDFMTMIADEYSNEPVGEYARQWLNTVVGSRLNTGSTYGTDPWVAAVDPGGTALSFSSLPLDYYAPGNGFLFTKSTWASSAMSVLIQLGEGSHGSHMDSDWGSFQIYSGDENIAPEHAEYYATFLDGTGSGSTSAKNGILYNDVGQMAQGDTLGNPQVLAVESSTDFSYAAVNLTATYQMPVLYTYLGNLAAGYTVREFLFIKPLNTLFIIDRLQSTSSSVTQSFLLHTPGEPTIVDANDVTFTIGGQELFLTTLPTVSSHSYSVSNEGATDGAIDVYRLQDNVTGSADNVFLHAITTGPAGSDPVSVAITGQTSSTWTITFTSATLGTAVLVLNQGTFSLGGSFGYAASGTPQLSPLASAIQTITVTSNGPAWGSSGSGSTDAISGGGSTDVVLGALPSAADPATSNGSGTKSSLKLSGGAGISTTARQTVSLGTSQDVTQISKLVKDKAVKAILPESLLDSLSQDLILSKNKKAPVASKVTSG
jgi:PKD repeat protein